MSLLTEHGALHAPRTEVAAKASLSDCPIRLAAAPMTPCISSYQSSLPHLAAIIHVQHTDLSSLRWHVYLCLVSSARPGPAFPRLPFPVWLSELVHGTFWDVRNADVKQRPCSPQASLWPSDAGLMQSPRVPRCLRSRHSTPSSSSDCPGPGAWGLAVDPQRRQLLREVPLLVAKGYACTGC